MIRRVQRQNIARDKRGLLRADFHVKIRDGTERFQRLMLLFLGQSGWALSSRCRPFEGDFLSATI